MSDSGSAPWASHWRHVWIVGGSTGIGAEIVRQLAESGVHVTVSARSKDKLDAMAASSEHIDALPLDVTDLEGCKAAAEHFDVFPDLVIINAAVYEPMGLRKFDAAKANAMMRVNFEGAVNTLDPVMKHMQTAGRGHIALVASISGYFGLPMAAAYSPAKAALHNLAESLQPELKKAGITMSVINPGFVKTRLTEKNRFKMPQILEVDDAVRRILTGLSKKKFEVLFPLPFAGFIKSLRYWPRSWVFAFTRRMVP